MSGLDISLPFTPYCMCLYSVTCLAAGKWAFIQGFGNRPLGALGVEGMEGPWWCSYIDIPASANAKQLCIPDTKSCLRVL